MTEDWHGKKKLDYRETICLDVSELKEIKILTKALGSHVPEKLRILIDKCLSKIIVD